jgi:hypothetical protein
MNKDNYRISTKRDEIIKILNLKFKENQEFTVWQKDSKTNERLFITEAKLSSLDSTDGLFSIVLTNEHGKVLFQQNLDTYFLLKGEDFVFKTKLSRDQEKNAISFQAPREVRLEEMRTAPRKYFQESECVNINVTFLNKDNDNEKVRASCKLFNISNGGVCIIISKETLSEINLKKEIVLEGLNFFLQLENIKKAIVRNARIHNKKTIKSDETFAIGLEFQS